MLISVYVHSETEDSSYYAFDMEVSQNKLQLDFGESRIGFVEQDQFMEYRVTATK